MWRFLSYFESTGIISRLSVPLQSASLFQRKHSATDMMIPSNFLFAFSILKEMWSEMPFIYLCVPAFWEWQS